MTNFNLTIGNAASATRFPNLSASKYNVAPRSAPFDAQVDGQTNPAWTTEGRGSHYIYFKQGDQLYYIKMAGPSELAAARQGLVVESEAYATKFQAAEPTKKPAASKRAPKTRAKAKAKA